MAVDRVQFQDIVASQLPRYVREDFPLLTSFLEQYYISQEYQGGVIDLVSNLDQYVKVDELYNLKNSTVLLSDISYGDTTIETSSVGNFTEGFPETNGLIKIGDEIIRYEYKTDSSFVNCTRGFSGVTSYTKSNQPDELVFSTSDSDEHSSGSTIYNLNILFLQEFFKKLKRQVVPGFSDRSLYTGLDQRNFIYNSDSFYKSKGTDESFEILFRALYGVDVKVIKPTEYLLRPSDANYRIVQKLVVEEKTGNPLDLTNLTLFQDQTGARGSVTNVEQIQYDQGQYYRLSVDFGYQRDIDVSGTIFSEFIPNPVTKILNSVSSGSTIVDVDSTVGFGSTGSLISQDSDGNDVTLTYLDKNDNQFLNVSGIYGSLGKGINIHADQYAYAYVGINTLEKIEVRVTATLKDFKKNEQTYLFKKDDKINLQSIGIEKNDEKSQNWLYNVKTNWEVENVKLLDATENSYEVTTYDEVFLSERYNVNLIDVSNNNSTVTGTVKRVTGKRTFQVDLSSSVTVTNTFKVENQLLKGNSGTYQNLEDFPCNVQNVYTNYEGEYLVASNSIPNYSVESNPYDRKVTFSGTFNGTDTITLTPSTDHGLYTGDAVWYKPAIITTTTTNADGITITTQSEDKLSNVEEGILYVYRIDQSRIKLSRSRSDLFAGNYVSLTGTVTNNELIYYNFYNKELSPQRIYRSILPPVNKSGEYATVPGYTGMLINGVEILNYKSIDTIAYGDILSFDASKGGSGYDVINPPTLHITDQVGTGATGTCCVTGSLKRIDIIDNGFDYVDKPTIRISGGNGTGAAAEPNMSAIIHSVKFNAEAGITTTNTVGVGITNDTIGFSTFHKFAQSEKVVYISNNLTNVGGLSTGASYYVNLVNDYSIQLHTKESDATSGINTVSLTSLGSGIQRIQSAQRKNIVSSIVITNSGTGYQNKKRTIPTSGINTSLNQIKIVGHGYESKEIIKYTGSNLSGVSTTKDYYVVKVDNDTFSLSEVGTGATPTDYYYNNGVIVDILSEGTGSFNYKPITVTVEGNIGVSTNTGQNFSCIVQPIFRGSVDSLDLSAGGVGYGASEVVNFDRQPDITLRSGENAQLIPVVDNGIITDIIIQSSGNGYNSPPDITINSSTGRNAALTPIIRDGKIVDVVIAKGGIGYSSADSITVTAAGSGAIINANIRKWNINLFERNFNIIEDDDGFVEESINDKTLEYCHIYAPRELRKHTYSVSGNEPVYGNADLTFVSGFEADSKYHSPILGWAYDGNPIYGPFGFTSVSSGTIKRMVSGYELQADTTNRPPTTVYPEGFFIEDYVYTGKGDLDEHNGRYCITPDYPNGVYAYFATINSTVDSSGPFKNYKRPVFPYLIGHKYNSQPNLFNFRQTSNQIEYNLQNSSFLRCTQVYHTNDDKSGYDYIFNSKKKKPQTIDITSASVGSIESVGILTGGTNYKINDRVDFNNDGSGGRSADVRVSRISGKTIDTISVASTSIYNVEFIKYNQSYIGFAATPHGLLTNDVVQISGISTYFKGFNGSYPVGVRSDNFVLTLGIGTTAATGDVTYLYVSGALGYPNIRPNDILRIGTEEVKVLNVDADTQRIRVLRAQNNTVGVAHTSREILYEDPRKFTVNISGLTTDKNFTINRELYFDPAESVGTGTATGAGIGTTVTFSNPGIGATQVFVPTRAIYIPNHNLKINDILTYSTNGGTPLYVWNGIGGTSYNSLSNFQYVYAAPITNDLVGISSNKVGMGSTGYVGINTSTNLLYFTNTGIGDTHSFTTNYDNIISGQVTQNIVTVSTASTHNLSLSDRVFVEVKPIGITTVSVRYNSYNRRIVFDPKSFTAGDIDISNDTIAFDDQYFNIGDRVIHTSSSPAGGLVDEKMYYVLPYNETKIRLVENYFELSSQEPKYVNITSSGDGTLSKINPQVKSNRNIKLKFDLSDSSLSFVNNSTRYSAFDFALYSDKEYNNNYLTSGNSSTFEVSSSGKIGIDTSANLTLNISDNVPTNLYYKFTPTNLDIVPDDQKGISIDDTISNFNEIEVVKTAYDGNYQIVGLGTTTFSYNVPVAPEATLYNTTNSNISYETSSTSASGSITQLKIYDGGRDYRTLPGITSVISGVGSGAILEAQSTSVGRILTTKFNDIGFDYPSDTTLRVTANIPENLKVDPLTSFESIGISSGGKNYLVAPDLIVIDGFTGNVVEDVDLKYSLGDTSVRILKNTQGIYNTTPTILPVKNSNGVGISSLTYDSATKVVRLYLNTQFSNAEDFPFAVGENIMVENISVGGIGTTGKGYNSKNYGYTLFPVTAADSQLGGSGAYVEYSLDPYIQDGSSPGSVDGSNSAGRAIPQNHFPIFDIKLKKNDFFVGERVTNGTKVGVVGRWDPLSEYVIVSTDKEFTVGTKIIGQSSGAQATIKSKLNFSSEVITGAGATVIDGWQSNSGFLNDNLQRLPNNEYYQTLSYSLKSSIPYGTWDDAVSSMNHTAGFAKFADYVAESKEDTPEGIVQTQDSGVDITVDIIGTGKLNCVYDFDYATEKTINVDGIITSTEVIFENGVFVDYFESFGNRVLSIDDISGQFNSNERETRYTAIADFSDHVKYTKIFNFVQDINLQGERKAAIISVLQHDEIGYIQEYATIETGAELGYYDYQATSDGFNINFYPNDYEFTRYALSSVSFDAINNVTGVGSTNIGTISLINSYQTNVAAATTTTIVSISSTYRASKALIMLENDEQQFTASELNILHDGTDVYMTEFGDLSVSLTPDFTGFGTFHSYIDGSQIKVDFIPSVGVALTANSNVVSIANSEATGIGSVRLDVCDVTSHYASIAASGSPTAVNVASYHDPILSSYNLVSVEDLTNNEYEMFEAILLTGITDENEAVFVEFANMSSGAGLGTVGFSTDSGNHLTFTPEPNIDVEVRTYSMGMLVYDANLLPTGIGFTNTELTTHAREYRGTRLELATSFGLKHNGLEIFRRSFDGNSTSIVDLTGNFVRIPDHFFVTGEKVTYQYSGTGTENAIGIATTTVPGIGSTDKLPTELYIVKNSDVNLRFAATAEDALASVPNTFDITTVGIGTSHHIRSSNPNPRVMIAIDNIIQSPIISAGVTHSLADNIVFDTNFELSGISSIFADDLIKIEDEYMLVLGVGVGGANNVTVRRAQMGSQAVRHNIGTLVTKISGNYNIEENTLHFTSPPYGNTPIGTTSGDPDNRDWTGITTSSTFQGRSFMRSAAVGSTTDTYGKNYVFDDISRDFTGISSQFTLSSDKNNVAGFSTDNAIVLINGIFQLPQGEQPTSVQRGDYDLEEGSVTGITTITFTGNSELPFGYDPNRTAYPTGGQIVSVGSTEGFGYQPLVSAGGTAVVSGLGTISSISIGNSGSGYRVGIQTVVNVGVQTYSSGTPNIEFIGTAAISGGHIVSIAITNPGAGYTSTNPPEVVIDSPLPYSNIPLVYSSDSLTGSGQSATVDITVGQGSSVINFEFNNYGFGYGPDEILTVNIGGVSGIPTDTTKTFNEFQITIDRTFSDQFTGWNIGQLQVIDALDNEFDGLQNTFAMKINGEPFSAKTRKGSNVDLVQTLIVFINDVLQEPNLSYTFKGGSLINFNEAPKEGDISKILFYKGTDGLDVQFVDIIESLKVGDDIELNYDPDQNQSPALDQDPRVITGINTVDSVTTNPYITPGITTDRSLSRPVIWCKQTVDRIIDGQKVGKDRPQYEPQIYPSSYILKSVGTSTDRIYVDTVRPLYDANNEATIRSFQDVITIVSQDNIVGASATAIVSGLGTISSLTITNPGIGYTVAPQVTIANPVGLDTTSRASVTSTISGVGTVATLTVSSPGTGYTSSNPPIVLIETPNVIREKANVTSYTGDDGIVVGVGTTVSGSQDQFFFDLFIPMHSPLRNASVVGTAITISGISTSEYLVISDTDISIGSTFASQDVDGNSVGVGTTFIDCVYQVAGFENRQMTVAGVSTVGRRIFVNVDTVGTGIGTTTAPNMGNYSWGKIVLDVRTESNDFNFYGDSGVTGITTSAIVSRFNSLKFKNYIV